MKKLLLLSLIAIGFSNVLLVSEQLSAGAVAPKKQAPPLPPLPGAQKKDLIAKATNASDLVYKTIDEIVEISQAAKSNPLGALTQITVKLTEAMAAQRVLNKLFINLLQSK